MFVTITRDHFRIDTVVPAIQSFAALLATQVVGRLGQYSVSVRTTAVLSLTAGVVSSLANNFFEKPLYQYLAIPTGVGAGILAHRFFYPRTELNAVVGVKEFLILSTIIAAVKLAANNTDFFSRAKEKIAEKANDVKERVAEEAEALTDEARHVVGQAADALAAGAENIKNKVDPAE